MTRVAIIDDHSVVRVGLKAIVGMEKDFIFAGERPNAADAVAFVKSAKPDVLLLDIRMPDKDGLEALKEILAANPSQAVIMLTTSDADNDIYSAIKLGARGYLLKDRDSDDIAKAIRVVADGGTFIPESVRELYRERQMMDELTPRETEVLSLMVGGYSNKEIASGLGVSIETIKSQTKSIFDKLGVEGRVSAVTEAIRRGLVKQS